MKFSLESSSGAHRIQSYSADEIRVGDQVLRASCIITADALIPNWPPATLEDLTLEHFEVLFPLEPEVVLLGTGPRHRFAPAAIRSAFLTRRIGLETMELGAACRTFNILAQEERRVAAALLLR